MPNPPLPTDNGSDDISDEAKQRMQPSPEVYYRGQQVSDWSAHADILDNPVAQALSDQQAVAQAKALGFSDEELKLITGGWGK